MIYGIESKRNGTERNRMMMNSSDIWSARWAIGLSIHGRLSLAVWMMMMGSINLDRSCVCLMRLACDTNDRSKFMTSVRVGQRWRSVVHHHPLLPFHISME